MKTQDNLKVSDSFSMTAEFAGFEETIRLRGDVQYKGYNEAGEEVLSYEGHNLIVALGRQAICKLLAEGTAAKVVTQFGCGTGSVAPVSTDVAPLTAQFKKAIAGFSYPSTTQVKFDWTLEFAQANGLTVNEFGLFCVDNTLFARVVAGPVTKTASIRLVGSWIINLL